MYQPNDATIDMANAVGIRVQMNKHKTAHPTNCSMYSHHIYRWIRIIGPNKWLMAEFLVT